MSDLKFQNNLLRARVTTLESDALETRAQLEETQAALAKAEDRQITTAKITGERDRLQRENRKLNKYIQENKIAFSTARSKLAEMDRVNTTNSELEKKVRIKEQRLEEIERDAPQKEAKKNAAIKQAQQRQRSAEKNEEKYKNRLITATAGAVLAVILSIGYSYVKTAPPEDFPPEAVACWNTNATGFRDAFNYRVETQAAKQLQPSKPVRPFHLPGTFIERVSNDIIYTFGQLFMLLLRYFVDFVLGILGFLLAWGVRGIYRN
jgi:small-conductance mechanosensitive channel